jgi:hypothetical protein
LGNLVIWELDCGMGLRHWIAALDGVIDGREGTQIINHPIGQTRNPM